MKLDELRKLGEKATEGPWQNIKFRFDGVFAANEPVFSGYCSNADGKFIAAARNHWNALLAVIEAAKLARSTSDPVLAHYILLDVALAELEAIGGE